jgi:sugar phosphate isomerase/epimerase
MEIGIFETVFPRPSLGGMLDAVAASGIRCLQFDLNSAGIKNQASNINPELCREARAQLLARKITMSAVSGTFNMAHPDPQHREQGLDYLRRIAAHCRDLGTSVITLCTGTRNLQSMWHFHPENNSPQAWKDLLSTMKRAVSIAEEHRVTLVIEPEVSNVVDSAKKGRQLIDEVGSSALKVCMDGANIFHKGELPKMREILSEAFELLGKDIVLAHAKDLDHDGEAGHRPAGEGLLDYDFYITCLKKVKFNGAIVLHGLSEAQVPPCLKFLQDKLAHH